MFFMYIHQDNVNTVQAPDIKIPTTHGCNVFHATLCGACCICLYTLRLVIPLSLTVAMRMDRLFTILQGDTVPAIAWSMFGNALRDYGGNSLYRS